MSPRKIADGQKEVVAATSKGAGGWQFVNFSKPNQTDDEDTRRLIRVNAMLDYRRKQKCVSCHSSETRDQLDASNGQGVPTATHDLTQTAMIDHTTSSPEHLERIVPTTGIGFSSRAMTNGTDVPAFASHHPNGSDSHKEDSRGGNTRNQEDALSHPRTTLGIGMTEPVNAYPISSESKHHSFVLNYFVSMMVYESPVGVDAGIKGLDPLVKTWIPYALQDPALFLATLSFAAVHLEVSSKNLTRARILSYKMETIKVVNMNLQSSEDALSDSTIGAVAMLTALERISGSQEDLRIHMTALQRMVSMRGGLQRLGWEGVLHMFIAWQDFLAPTTVASPPQNALTAAGSPSRITLSYKSPIFSRLDASRAFCSELSNIFSRIRYITEQFTSPAPISTETQNSLSNMRTKIEDRVRSLTQYIEKPEGEMISLEYYFETLRLGALIYLEIALHPSIGPNFRFSNAKALAIQQQILSLLKRGELACVIGVQPCPLPGGITWALFTGGILAADEDEEAWWAQRIARGVRTAGIREWGEMEAQLRKIAWRNELTRESCTRLWKQVGGINRGFWN
ncbi:hypothetical protein N7G274_005686 [Stereocaulon virgatum]|uniref:Uncharacterized protein n=1 Tax=Stereocaulon virgatum TaxID=373712 RepID=A0ABR4A721_9LECA